MPGNLSEANLGINSITKQKKAVIAKPYIVTNFPSRSFKRMAE